MNRIQRSLAIPGLACAALLATAAPALAEDATAPSAADDVTIVDEPDTSDLHNKWTFAPLGVPVFGLIDSVQDVPDRLF